MTQATQTLSKTQAFLDQYVRPATVSAAGAWAGALRAPALERFEALGLPTTRDEEWRFTSLAALERLAPATAPFTAEAEAAAEGVIAAAGVLLEDADRLVFVNGRFSARLSRLAGPYARLRAGSLAQAVSQGDAAARAHLGQSAPWKAQPFVALNTALMTDGPFVFIPRGQAVAEPLQVLYVTAGSPGSDGAQPAAAAHPRALFILEESSQACIIESHLGAAGQAYFSNPVTEIILGEDARLDHYRMQEEGLDAVHLGAQQATLARSAALTTTAVAVGAALSRVDIGAALLGEGVECFLNGLYLVAGRQHADHHTRLDHAQPHGHSNQLYKGILDDQASAVFTGRIHVWPDAQKTDAIQSNRNLLLTAAATVNTQPQLEIFADDVRCTHGATVGQLDADALFYLRARGIDRDTARGLLTYAFANEVIERVGVEALRARLERLIFERFQGRRPNDVADEPGERHA